MINIPNILSLLRLPLAVLFLKGNIPAKTAAILLAALTDFFDGYLARRYQQMTRFGTVLDPIADKFFVLLALCLFFSEGKINIFEACAMLCRDFSVLFFGLYLLLTNNFKDYEFRSIWCGKVTTSLQLIVLLGLTYELPIPSYAYGIFILLGAAALVELYISARKNPITSSKSISQ